MAPRTTQSATAFLLAAALPLLFACGERTASTSSLLRPAVAPAPPPPAALTDGFEDNEVVLVLAPGASITAVNGRYGTETLEALPEDGRYRVSLPAGTSVADMLTRMAGDAEILNSEPNFGIADPEGRQSSLAFDDGVDVPSKVQGQDALHRLSVEAGQAAAQGGRGVLVAVIDTGIDPDHPYLAASIEAGGYDFVDGDSEPWEVPNGVDDDGDLLVDEALGHGTHVSGLIVAMAPACRLLPIRILNDDGVGTSFNLGRAIRYAADHGAQVINLSLGMLSDVEAVASAVEYARAMGAICVAAAGNDGRLEVIHYPAGFGHVISVLSVDGSDVKASFSNYAEDVNVAAPGIGIYSTYWDGGFATWSGTSMSTAIVSGAVALLRAHEPGFGPDEIREAVRARGVDITAQNPAIGEEIGRGRLDVAQLLGVPASPPQGPPPADRRPIRPR